MGRLRVLFLLPLLVCTSLTIHAQGPPAPLQMGTPIDRTLAAGQTHEFTVTLEENSYIQLVVEQKGIDVVVKVFSPEGRAMGEFDSPNGNDGPEHVSFTGTAAGVYRITVGPLDPANSPPGNYQIKILELRPATEQEIKASRNLEDVKAKGVALLLDLEETISQIQSPLTRINAQLLAAQLLWEPEQKRASKYFTDAANGVKELIASIDGSNPNYSQQFGLISQLRFEITRLLAQRDPEAALSFLYSTVPPPNPYSNRRQQASQEGMMELALANQIMQKDPSRGLEIARKNLKTRLSVNLLNTVSVLRQQNPEMAAELANEIAGKVLQEKLLKNVDAANLAIGLLRSGMRPERRSVGSDQYNWTQTRVPALIPEAQYRELLQKALSEALSFTPASPQVYSPEREAASNLLMGLRQLGSELNAATPGGLAAVEKKFNELTGRNSDPYQYQNAIGNNPVDTSLETIAKAPQEQREQLYIQLANREATNGDISRARQIVNERISNPGQRFNSIMYIDQMEITRALGKGKADEALRVISGFRTTKERASYLALIAGQIGPGQKRGVAINLLEQAKALLGPAVPAPDQEHMNALLEIGRAFARYDAKRSFEILDPLIDQVNDICAAARTMEGFGVNNFNDDELDLQNGSGIATAINKMSNTLGTLAVTNFERAKADADRLRLPEVRLKAYLDIAQQSISGAVR